MRKFVIGLVLVVILSVLNGVSTQPVYGADHKLEDLYIHVLLNQDGSAKITEKRRANLSEGTENYIVIENLGKSTIQNFTVVEDGKTYEQLKKWDLNASRQKKAFKNGVIKTKNGYELSWGIGEYGKHDYTIEYTVTDFIKQVDDAQILFWRFVNDQTNIPPEKVTVEIESAQKFSDAAEKIWAFGFPGEIQFENGKIIAVNDKPLTSSNYVTILVRFNDKMFTTNDRINKTFKAVQDEAFVGSDYESEGSSGVFSLLWGLFLFFVFGVFFMAIFFVIVIYILFLKKAGWVQRIFKRQFRGEYYRDYPYDGNFLDIHHLVYTMGLGNFASLFTTFLLKWIKEERITVDKQTGSGFFKGDIATLTIINDEMEATSAEGKLFNMIKEAMGENNTIQDRQLSNWAEHNRARLHVWEQQIKDESVRLLKELNHIQDHEVKILFFHKKGYEPTESGLEIEKKVYLFINYLHDYSLLNEHEAVNVHIWDELMIWASYLGLTKVVREQFKSLYPQYVNESIYRDDAFIATTMLVSKTEAGRSPSSNSGSGGSSSSGGGGGSFGGGSGGGTR